MAVPRGRPSRRVRPGHGRRACAAATRRGSPPCVPTRTGGRRSRHSSGVRPPPRVPRAPGCVTPRRPSSSLAGSSTCRQCRRSTSVPVPIISSTGRRTYPEGCDRSDPTDDGQTAPRLAERKISEVQARRIPDRLGGWIPGRRGTAPRVGSPRRLPATQGIRHGPQEVRCPVHRVEGCSPPRQEEGNVTRRAQGSGRPPRRPSGRIEGGRPLRPLPTRHPPPI